MLTKKKIFENKTALVWKMAIASAISWEMAKLVGSDHPYLAPLSVVLCLQTTIDQSIRFSIHRVLGTAIGVFLTAYLVSNLPMNGWILGLLMLGGTYIAKRLRLDETVLHQVAITILLVFVFERNSKDYGLDRIVDTIIGVVIALLIHMSLFPPDFTKGAAESFQKLAQQFSEMFLELSRWVQIDWGQEKGNMMEYKIDNLLEELHTTKEMLQTASKSLKFNPISKRHQIILSRYQIEMQKMNAGYEYILNIVKTLKEWEKESTLTSNDKMELGNDLKVISKVFDDYKGKQQDEIKDWNEMEQNILLDSLHSKVLSYPLPSQKIYKDFFYLETARFLKNL